MRYKKVCLYFCPDIVGNDAIQDNPNSSSQTTDAVDDQLASDYNREDPASNDTGLQAVVEKTQELQEERTSIAADIKLIAELQPQGSCTKVARIFDV